MKKRSVKPFVFSEGAAVLEPTRRLALVSNDVAHEDS